MTSPSKKTAEHFRFLNKSAQETEQPSKGYEEKGKDGRALTFKGSCPKGGKCSFEHDLGKNGKGKGTRSRSPVKRNNYAERHNASSTVKKSIWKRRPPRVSNSKEEIVVMIESVIIATSSALQTLQER